MDILGKKAKIDKTLKGSFCMHPDEQLSFKCFPENAFVSKIFPKLSSYRVVKTLNYLFKNVILRNFRQ